MNTKTRISSYGSSQQTLLTLLEKTGPRNKECNQRKKWKMAGQNDFRK
jgi:hypothetical protein